MTDYREIYRYWIGDGRPQMKLWFEKNEATDREIRERFGAWMDQDPARTFAHWQNSPEGMVSLLILLDQFPRNAFRGTARMFAYDRDALAFARTALDKGWPQTRSLSESLFLALPFEHSESRDDQKVSVSLCQQMIDRATPDERAFAKSVHDYALRHQVIIDRFGRFPHRNQILGRPSTPEEIEFLKQPGSGF